MYVLPSPPPDDKLEPESVRPIDHLTSPDYPLCPSLFSNCTSIIFVNPSIISFVPQAPHKVSQLQVHVCFVSNQLAAIPIIRTNHPPRLSFFSFAHLFTIAVLRFVPHYRTEIDLFGSIIVSLAFPIPTPWLLYPRCLIDDPLGRLLGRRR